jgi:hypothetical protein
MANPTTNYGFVLPTATDLVTDLPADFDVALQGVDTRLKALQPGTTLGDLAYSSATANTNTRLAIGSTGNVLTVAGGVPTWAAPAGGGKVLQVVMGSTSTTMTTSSSTFADTNLTGTITPSSATSKVLVLVSQNGCLKFGGTAANGMGLKLLRGSTDIAKMADAGMILAGSTANNGDYAFSTAYLDSPATTSATTYKTQANASGNAVQMILQNGGCLSTIILLEIGA